MIQNNLIHNKKKSNYSSLLHGLAPVTMRLSDIDIYDEDIDEVTKEDKDDQKHTNI